MVNKLIAPICILLCLSGCGKAPQDKFIGTWSYTGSGKLMTVPLNCSIDLSIVKKNKTYILSNLSLHLNPSVFGLNGGEFFHDAELSVKDDNTMSTPTLPSGTPIIITYLKDSNQIALNPNPCNGITPAGMLSKKNN